MQNTKRANTMSTITVELTIKVKTKFTSSNAEKIKWIHLTTDVTQFSQMVPQRGTFVVIPPLAIANQYHDQRSNQSQSVRYRLILVRASDLDWLQEDQHSLRDLYQLPYTGTAVNVGYPRLRVKHSAQAHPPRTFLY